ncbi:GlxA family transcriptional regulator, partial [Gallaecimonas xiamenensis]
PAESYDLLLVVGGPGAYSGSHPNLCTWLRDMEGRVGRLVSVCTGAFLLGEAGLLDGHRVTTHWNYTEQLAQAYPKAKVEQNQIFINDKSGVISCGGITAGIDLALSLIEADHGRQLAVQVAKVLLVVMRRQGGQVQFSPLHAEVTDDETVIGKVQRYVLEHLDEDFSVESLAAMAAMSQRHFARSFAQEVKMTPMEFVRAARVDSARKLLENSALPLKTIAYQSGFASTRQMRQQFNDKLGLTPAQYRRQFG